MAGPRAETTAKSLQASKRLTHLQWSCCADPRTAQPLWNKMAADPADLYIHVGQHFPITDKSKMTPEELLTGFNQQSDFINFRSKVPVMGVWDEDDYGTLSPANNGEHNPDRENSRLQYFKFYNLDSERIDPRQRGIYHSVILGDSRHKVQILFLDTHFFRSDLVFNKTPKFPKGPYVPSKNKKTTILGSEQWAWLQKEFKTPVEFRILVTPTQFISSEQGQESWALFPESKKAMLNLLQKQNEKFTLFLSGNRLHGEMQKLKDKKGHVLLDVTAGGINRVSPSAYIPEASRVGSWLEEPNYADLQIDWEHRKAVVRVIGEKNHVLQTHADF